jgi:hypothetical protein
MAVTMKTMVSFVVSQLVTKILQESATSYFQVRSSALKTEAAGSSNTVTRYQTITCHTPEDSDCLMERCVTTAAHNFHKLNPPHGAHLFNSTCCLPNLTSLN